MSLINYIIFNIEHQIKLKRQTLFQAYSRELRMRKEREM